MVNTHLAVRMTAQRHICKDCGKKRWGPQSPRSRAACPATLGRANRTVAVGEEGEAAAAAAGRAAEGSGTETETPSGYSPSGHTERSKEYRKTVRGTQRWRGEIDEDIGFSKIHQRLNSHCSWMCKLLTVKQNQTKVDAGAGFTTSRCNNNHTGKQNMAKCTFLVERCSVMTLKSRFSSFDSLTHILVWWSGSTQEMDWNKSLPWLNQRYTTSNEHTVYYIENAWETHKC